MTSKENRPIPVGAQNLKAQNRRFVFCADFLLVVDTKHSTKRAFCALCSLRFFNRRGQKLGRGNKTNLADHNIYK